VGAKITIILEIKTNILYKFTNRYEKERESAPTPVGLLRIVAGDDKKRFA